MAKHQKHTHQKLLPQQKTIHQKITTKKEFKPNFLDTLYSDYIDKHPFITFLVLLLGIATFVFWDFIMLDKVYLFKDIASDSINIFYPHFVLGEFSSKTDLLYTFRNGFGVPINHAEASIFDQLLGFIGAPHSFFITHIVNLFTDEILYRIFYQQLGNVLAGGIIFYFYLHIMGVNSLTKIVGGLAFAFCTVMILGFGWYETGYPYYASILLLGFELMYKKKIWIALPFAIFLSLRGIGIFFFYGFGIMLFAYSIVRYLEENEWKLKQLTVFMLQFGGLALLGLLMNTTIIHSTIIALLDNPRVTGDVSLTEQLKTESSFFADAQFYLTTFLRLFSTDMAGGGIIDKVVVEGRQYLIPNYRGWQNYYEGPMFYVGLLTLIFIPLFFLTKNTLKKKLLFGVYLLIYSLPIIFPYLHRAFWAFQGEYFRAYSLALIFPFFYVGLKGINSIQKDFKINYWAIIGVSTIFVIALLVLVSQLMDINPQFYNLAPTAYDNSVRNMAIVFISLYTLFLLIIRIKHEYKAIAIVSILFVLFVELAYMSNFTVNHRLNVTNEEFRSKTGYNDYTVDALAYLKSVDSTFYRIEKEYQSGTAVHGSLNDSYIQGYFGTSIYSSFPDARYLRFQQELGLIKKGDALAARWISGLRSRPLLLTLINGKYLFSKNPQSQYAQFGYQNIHTIGDVFVYQNMLALPLGFTYDKIMLKSDFDRMSNFQKDVSLLRAVLLEDSLAAKIDNIQKFNVQDTVTGFSIPYYQQITDSLRGESLKLESFKEDHFKGSIAVSKPKIMYLSVLYDKNWIVEIDGKHTETFFANMAFTGFVVPQGEHKVEIYYSVPKIENVSPSKMIARVSVGIYLLLIGLFGFQLYNAKRKQSDEAQS